MNKKNISVIRTRFAPSPTGELHLGGARTALFNYLLAKKSQGKFILRIEDTDQERSKEEYINNQYNDLLWLGLKPDESPFFESKHGPYQQTKRLDIYQKYAQELLDKKKVYYCFCSKEELAKEKEEYLVKKKANYQYSRKCLQLSPEQIQNFLQTKKPYVLRLKVPQEKDYGFQDLVRGKITFQGKDIEDFVIFRSNGFPLLNFAVVIDDHLMGISHVLRGEEHISNTAKQLVLYKALGWNSPQFGHLSIILNKERQKLSKRDQTTSEFQMIYQLRQKGYLPQAIINYLLFLGWHPGRGITQEIFNLKEAIENFNLKGLHTQGAVFTLEKLNWYNNYYIQQLEEKEFEKQSWKVLQKEYQLAEEKKEWVQKIAFLFRPRLNCFQELINLSRYFFQEPLQIDLDLPLSQLEKLKETKELLTNLEDWKEESVRQALQTVKNLFPLIRRKLTGQKSGPELPKIIYLLGKEKVLKRLKLKS
ncbi:glutamate--tRNA ligase [endosymbiont GvMRE of Glomus versiforme]|uniref:glutamate--tRNA ligase n=1 Tax=endosymbiont GvMRE of Glomus versiforme TaxID=2039283 RepID=UPI000ED1239F|nr:glutamate--tRNA ligase [endosymbiont GvMRE of Glomus versiforme]RHZ35971.1 Glutamate--tRNA ligase [endosymbiont GvMRE of Glomus versiforme]